MGGQELSKNTLSVYAGAALSFGLFDPPVKVIPYCKEYRQMKTERTSCIQANAQGRLITFSQWDGSALWKAEEKGPSAVARDGKSDLAPGTLTEGASN